MNWQRRCAHHWRRRPEGISWEQGSIEHQASARSTARTLAVCRSAHDHLITGTGTGIDDQLRLNQRDVRDSPRRCRQSVGRPTFNHHWPWAAPGQLPTIAVIARTTASPGVRSFVDASLTSEPDPSSTASTRLRRSDPFQGFDVRSGRLILVDPGSPAALRWTGLSCRIGIAPARQDSQNAIGSTARVPLAISPQRHGRRTRHRSHIVGRARDLLCKSCGLTKRN